MQFQNRGKIIRVLAYRGYDAEKKRAKIEMIGSLSLSDLVPNDKLLENMSDKEKLELSHYIDKEQHARQEQRIIDSVKYLPENIDVAIKGIREGIYPINDDEAQALFAAMDSLAKQLKKSGYVRGNIQR
jgi:hypothetical protein